jgi:hypothetical protein
MGFEFGRLSSRRLASYLKKCNRNEIKKKSESVGDETMARKRN